MTAQELINKSKEIDPKSKIVCVTAFRKNIYINDIKESTIWNEINLIYDPMK